LQVPPTAAVQQPLAQVLASHTHWPLEVSHRCPCAESQAEQRAPATPQAALVSDA
jgi:hypothetical protein